MEKADATFWRTLEELAGARATPEEFAPGAAGPVDEASRRDFLSLMAAGMALAGLGGCARDPLETIVPPVRAPEDRVPGRPLYYATAAVRSGYGFGVLVESHEGRPTKVEGNPEHPASLGATDAITQAEVLTLYDPDRSQVVTRGGRISTWASLVEVLRSAAAELDRGRGEGLRLLTGGVTSPSEGALVDRLLDRYPRARWHVHEPLDSAGAREGARLAFGRDVDCGYALQDADVIVSLDADFLMTGPGAVRYARDFARRRAPDAMNRLYVLESTLSVTGASADHRRAVASGDVAEWAWRLWRAVREGGADDAWIAAVARDLVGHRGRSLVVAGEGQPGNVHALAHRMNGWLHNTGRTVRYVEPIREDRRRGAGSLEELTFDMREGRVEVLLILEANPVYSAPADVEFAAALERVTLRVHAGLYADETARLCHWHVPLAHAFESWGDVRAFDGTATILQPLIAPLYGAKSPHEIFGALLGPSAPSAREAVRAYWRTRATGEEFEAWWEQALHDGVVAGSHAPAARVELQPEREEPVEARKGGLELAFHPDPTVWDGRYANNAWLQELPKPMTTLTWENAALVSPRLAARLGVAGGDVVELSCAGRRLEAPVWILPGQADTSVSLHLGYGRTHAGRVGSGTGVNAYALRSARAAWFAPVEIRRVGRKAALAATQGHHLMENRALARAADIERYRRDAGVFRREGDGIHPSLYPEAEWDVHEWGMAIDLSACIGCGACVIACQAENNVPTVGKGQVLNHREMHWIRVDRYFEGDPEAPRVVHQPVLCMHCEKAPCEVVCPVMATTHSRDGLNEMTYNRCVGTRYCSNNCPYKVRRFNFLEYVDTRTPVLRLLRNPDVTVRSRGVMEKCTYCVQRISVARIEAKREGRAVRDGEVQTACQAACPTRAIVFGNLADPTSGVSRLKAEPRNYALLGELNTRPRTTYLGRLRNPNPELAGGERS